MKTDLRFKVKILAFLEILTVLVCGIMHVICNIVFGNFPLVLYPIMMVIIFGAVLFTFYVVAPFADWFFELFETKD